MGYKLYQRVDGGSWTAYFVDRDGQRHRKSTKQADKRRATFVADEWYRRLADPTYSAANATTIDDASKRLIASLRHAKRSKATVEHFYPTKLSHIARVMGGEQQGDMPLAKIDAKRVDMYIATREEEGAAAYTISKELTALRQMLKHARRRGEFDKELSQVMPIAFATGYKPRERRLTIAEVWTLIRDLEERESTAARYVAFVCATTARDSAAGRAAGKHLLPGVGIAVHDLKTKGSFRTVPFTEVTLPFAQFAFTDVEGDALVAPSVSSIRHAIDRATKRLGMAHVSPNDLRRSVAHWLLERGVARDAAAAFMGHANTKMLDAVYGKLDTKELGATIARSLTLTAAPEGALDAPPESAATPESPASIPAGSCVEETWHNAAITGADVDAVDSKTSTKEPKNGARSVSRTHGTGIFNPLDNLSQAREKGSDRAACVDGLWKRSKSPSDRAFWALSWLWLAPWRASVASMAVSP